MPKKVLSKKEIKQIKQFAGVLCTWLEIASLIEWSGSTLEKNKVAVEAYAEGRAEGLMSLRRAQFDIAVEDRNSSMAIWLGKCLLHQKETQQISTDDKGAAHVTIGAMVIKDKDD